MILTHKHPDHAGSVDAVLSAAPGGDRLHRLRRPGRRPGDSTRSRPVNDGDSVFGLTIVGTPGHTAGHVAVLDEAGGILRRGRRARDDRRDAVGSNPQNTEDVTAAKATVVKIGKLRFETLLVGHGEPILTGASAQVAALAAAS